MARAPEMGRSAPRPAPFRGPEHEVLSHLLDRLRPHPPRLRLPRVAKACEFLERDTRLCARRGYDTLLRSSRIHWLHPDQRLAQCFSVGRSSTHPEWTPSRRAHLGGLRRVVRGVSEPRGGNREGKAPLPLGAQLRAPGFVPPRDHRDTAATLARTRELRAAHGRRRCRAAACFRRLPRTQGRHLWRKDGDRHRHPPCPLRPFPRRA